MPGSGGTRSVAPSPQRPAKTYKEHPRGLLFSSLLPRSFYFAIRAEGWDRVRAQAGSLGFWTGGALAD